MYLVKVETTVHIVRRASQVTLCGQPFSVDTMLIEPFRSETTCDCCDRIALQEVVETKPVSPQLRSYILQKYG